MSVGLYPQITAALLQDKGSFIFRIRNLCFLYITVVMYKKTGTKVSENSKYVAFINYPPVMMV